MTDNTTRYALGVEYEGSRFHGWQKQPDVLSVQAVLEAALASVADHEVALACAGRTDKGVHALGQVVHFDCHTERPPSAFVRGANRLLPETVRVRWVQVVTDDFHARFSARARRYRYIVCNSREAPVFFRQGVSWWREPLDADLMHKAARHWLGEHDFSSFRASGCVARSPVKCVQAVRVFRHEEQIVVDITADAFLLHMVRNLMGALRLIGKGAQPPDWALTLLKARDRTRAPATAEPQGLYLVSVQYDAMHKLPETPLAKRLFEPFGFC